MRLLVARKFRREHCRHDRVLIARMGTAQIAVAFFESEHERAVSVAFPLLYLFADKLEARQHVVNLCAVIFGDAVGKTRSDYRLYHGGVFGQFAALLAPAQHVIHQKTAYLIARKGDEFPFPVPYGYAHAVAVGVGADDYVAASPVRQLYAQRKRFGLFGIGHGNGGKLGIGQFLLLHHVHVYTHARKHGGNGLPAAAVQGRIHYLYACPHLRHFLGRKGQFGKLRIIFFIHALAYHRYLVRKRKVILAGDIRVLFGCNVLARHSEIIALFDIRHNARRGFGRHLRAVLAVYLIAVVFLGIVAGGNHNARLAAQITHAERTHGHGAYVLVNVNFHAESA